MILVVSGEGSTDIGVCTSGQWRCNGDDFKPGAMGMIVNKIAENEVGFSFHDATALEFVSEAECAALAKQLRTQKKNPTFLGAGKRSRVETGYFHKGARALARLAMEETKKDKCPRGVVFFRDTDGTRSTERGLYETRLKSMQDGFLAEDEFAFGVPMLPKPKSEAWLICALKPNAYQNCGALEESLSGNDNAPEPAKEQLEALLAERGQTKDDLADMVNDGTIDALRAGMKDMRSFKDFEARLREVLQMLQR